MSKKQTSVRPATPDEQERILAECRRLGVHLNVDEVRAVLYAASCVYGNCDETAKRRRLQADADARAC